MLGLMNDRFSSNFDLICTHTGVASALFSLLLFFLLLVFFFLLFLSEDTCVSLFYLNHRERFFDQVPISPRLQIN